MNRRLLLNGSLRMLARNKLRTFFMGIGVIVGVATLIAGQSLGTGAAKQITERVDKMFGQGTILVFSRTLNSDDLDVIQQKMIQVEAIAPRFSAGELEVNYQGINRQAAVYGHAENGDYVWSRGVVDGRYFSSADIGKTARVALIGTRLATALFSNDDPIDQEILIASTPFQIIGLLEPAGIDPHGEDRDEDVFIPITTAMRRLNNANYVGAAKILVSNHELVDEDADELSLILRQLHHIAVGEKEDFFVYTSKYAGRFITKANKVLKLYLMLAAGVVLLVATAVISSIMLVVVRERIAEIGLRKAVGATPQAISFQFMLEAVGITLLAGLFGIAVGVLAANVISLYIDVPVVLNNSIIAMGLVSATIVGIGSGIMPARRAAALDPVESLK